MDKNLKDHLDKRLENYHANPSKLTDQLISR